MLKKLLTAFIFCALIFSGTTQANAAAKKPVKIAAFSMYLSSKALKAAYDSYIVAMNSEGLVAGKDYILETYDTNNDAVKTAEVIEKFKTGDYDLIYALGTAGSVKLKELGYTKPVVFAGVTDPVKSGVVADWVSSKNNFTGASNKQQVDKQIITIREINPKITRLGVVFKETEGNSKIQLTEIVEKKDKLKLTEVIPAPVKDETGLEQAGTSLVGKVDAIFFPADVLMSSANSEKLIKVATVNKIPVISANDASTQYGALFSIYSDYTKLGIQAWDLSKKVLAGAAPSSLPVEVQTTPSFVINLKAASDLGITIPDSVLSNATKIIE